MLRKNKVLKGYHGSYKILNRVGSGGFGLTYEAVECSGSSGRVIVKTLNPARLKSLLDPHMQLGRMSSQFHSEVMASNRLRGLRCVARVIDNGVFDAKVYGGSHLSAPFLVQRFVEGDDLDRYCEDEFGKPFSGIGDSRTFFLHARKISESVLRLHQRGVIHGDITRHNVRMSDGGKRAVLIDLGQARFVAFQINNANTRRGWPPHVPPEGSGTIQADLYSLGCLLYYLATGDDDPPTDADNDRLKRSLEVALDRKNAALNREAPGIADIIGRCLRLSPTSRPAHARMVINDIDAFSGKTPTAPANAAIKSPLFARMARSMAQEHRRLISEMKSGVFDMYGDHEAIVSGMTEYLSFLEAGDEYLTVSVPKFWHSRKIGIDGRFLAMNKLVAQRGASVRRVFVVTPTDEAADPEFYKIMEAQGRLVDEMARLGQQTGDPASDSTAVF